jgi:hypothetical protein
MKDEAKDKQLSTEVNESEYEKLDPIYQYVIELRLMGASSKHIANDPTISKSLGIKHQTVRTWFAINGMLYAAYQEEKREWTKENRQRVKEIKSSLEGIGPDAVQAYRKAIAASNWKAAESLLDRIGFKPKDKVELSGNSKKPLGPIIYIPDNGRTKPDH